MKQSTMEAYAEIDTILNFMSKKDVQEIPEKLRKLFREKKSENYTVNITPNKPLEEQNLSSETLAILAVLNYNYWCKDENKKKELLDLYSANEAKYQEELRERYNPDNIFKNKKEVVSSDEKSEELTMVKYEEKKWYQKIFDKILNIFKKQYR